MPFENIQAQAGGDIRTCRFIKVSSTAYELLEADANERTIGISGQGAHDAPLPGSDGLAAADGESFRYHTIGEIALLEAGSGGFEPDDELKSDADGKGVPVATTGTTVQWVGAIALEAAAAGEKGRVQIVRYPWRPALT